MDSKKKNRLILVVITLAFLSPIVISWWVINYTDVVSAGGKSNYGDLFEPPRPIENLGLYDPVAEKEYELHGKWSLVYLADRCDQACLDNLYRMRQIHIAMDKHSLRVQRILVFLQQEAADLSLVFADYAGQRVINTDLGARQKLISLFKKSEDDAPLTQQRLYIIDPLGNLMMSYPADINPRGIMKDLKKLLKTSRIG